MAAIIQFYADFLANLSAYVNVTEALGCAGEPQREIDHIMKAIIH